MFVEQFCIFVPRCLVVVYRVYPTDCFARFCVGLHLRCSVVISSCSLQYIVGCYYCCSLGYVHCPWLVTIPVAFRCALLLLPIVIRFQFIVILLFYFPSCPWVCVTYFSCVCSCRNCVLGWFTLVRIYVGIVGCLRVGAVVAPRCWLNVVTWICVLLDCGCWLVGYIVTPLLFVLCVAVFSCCGLLLLPRYVVATPVYHGCYRFPFAVVVVADYTLLLRLLVWTVGFSSRCWLLLYYRYLLYITFKTFLLLLLFCYCWTIISCLFVYYWTYCYYVIIVTALFYYCYSAFIYTQLSISPLLCCCWTPHGLHCLLPCHYIAGHAIWTVTFTLRWFLPHVAVADVTLLVRCVVTRCGSTLRFWLCVVTVVTRFMPGRFWFCALRTGLDVAVVTRYRTTRIGFRYCWLPVTRFKRCVCCCVWDCWTLTRGLITFCYCPFTDWFPGCYV